MSPASFVEVLSLPPSRRGSGSSTNNDPGPCCRTLAVASSASNCAVASAAGQEEPSRLDCSYVAFDEFDGLTTSEATFSLVNTVVGVGVLSVPYAFRLSGYVTLLVMAAVIAVTWYTASLLGSSSVLAASSEAAKRAPPKSRDYIFLAYVAFGAAGRKIMMVITGLELWFALLTFIIMNGVNAAILWPEIGNGAFTIIGAGMAGAMVFLPLRVYSYVSIVSTAALLLAACALVGCAAEMRLWANPYQAMGEDALISVRNVPRSAGIIVFCFAGHPCFPVIHECMRERRSWGVAVGLTFLSALIYYGGLGVFGYVVFGPELEPSFTQNIARESHALFWRNVSVLAFMVKIQLTAPVLMNAVLVSLWAPEEDGSEWPAGRVALLVALVAITSLVCLFCTNSVAAVASLTGSLFVMATSVIFPVVLHLKLSYLYGQRAEPRRVNVARWSVAIALLLAGVLEAAVGTALAVSDLLATGPKASST